MAFSFQLHCSHEALLKFTQMDCNLPKLLLPILQFVSMTNSIPKLYLKVQVQKERSNSLMLSKEPLLCIDVTVTSLHLSPSFATQLEVPTAQSYQQTVLHRSELAPGHMLKCRYYYLALFTFACPEGPNSRITAGDTGPG